MGALAARRSCRATASRLIRWLALATALDQLRLLAARWSLGFNGAAPDAGGFRFVETVSWIPAFGIQYKVGVDGISLLLVVLTTLLTWISILASFGPIKERVKEYMISFLVLEVGMLGVFLALDLFLFYVFWEDRAGADVPDHRHLGRAQPHLRDDQVRALHAGRVAADAGGHPGHGVRLRLRPRRRLHGRLRLRDSCAASASPRRSRLGAFLAFFLAFAIKVPMCPFHTWLPDAHVEAPTAGSVILAGVLLKLGGYGFIRFSLPLYPQAAHDLAGPSSCSSLIAIIYGAIVALVQPDLKKLVAYSSVSHMGFVTLGIFVFQQQGLQGAVLQMVNHGLITGALFLLRGRHLRTHPRPDHRQAWAAWRARTPVYAVVFGFFMLASIGLPGLAGFVGEFLVFLGTFAISPVYAAVAVMRDDHRGGLPAVAVPAHVHRRPERVPARPRPPPHGHGPRWRS